MALIYRVDQHWRDEVRDPLHRKIKNRVVKNWSGYKLRGKWRITDVVVSESQSEPEDWDGQYDFSHESQKAPLQVFVRDKNTVGNSAMAGCRLSDSPSSWLNIRAQDIDNNVNPVFSSNTATWAGLWTNADLRFDIGAHKLAKHIVLNAPGHASSFDFTLRTAGSHSIEISDNAGVLKNDNGDTVLRISSPYGTDANGDDIRCTMTVVSTDGGLTRVRITPNPDDMSSAVYPVDIDPTTQVSGASALDDAVLFPGAPNNNYGARTLLSWRVYSGSPLNIPLWRIANSSIPSGTLSQCDFYLRFLSNKPVTTSARYVARVLSANNWVEGTQNGATETGSCCWNYLAYDASSPTSWAGSAGCGTADTDYDDSTKFLDAWYLTSPVSHTSTTFPNDWLESWRDGVYTNCGIVGANEFTAYNSVSTVATNEHSDPTTHPYFDITYTEAGGSPVFSFLGQQVI